MKRFVPQYQTGYGWIVWDTQTQSLAVMIGSVVNDQAARIAAEKSAAELNLCAEMLDRKEKQLTQMIERHLSRKN